MQHGRALVLVGQTVEPKMVLGLGRPVVMSFRWYIDGEGKNVSLAFCWELERLRNRKAWRAF